MNKAEMLSIVTHLGKDEEQVVFSQGKIDIFLLRPSILSKRFKEYDPDKNFQIWLRGGRVGQDFRPNHLRVMIDLNLRVRSRPDLKDQLLLSFDQIFYGEDPDSCLSQLKNEQFRHFLNDISVTGALSQLFLLEQEVGYNKESMFDPPSLFYQGWVREFIDNPREIDILCMSVCNRQPPKAKYVCCENKKSGKFDLHTITKPLWYLEEVR